MAAARMIWSQKWLRKQGRSKRVSRPASISAAKSVTGTFHWICFVMIAPSLVLVVTVGNANRLPRNPIKRDLGEVTDGEVKSRPLGSVSVRKARRKRRAFCLCAQHGRT